MSDSRQQASIEEPQGPIENLELFLQEKFSFEKELVMNVQEENKKLKSMLDEK